MRDSLLKIGQQTLLLLVTTFLLATSLYGHEGGHRLPDQLPPVGPHGGAYVRMGDLFAEIVVREQTVMLYVLEKDLKYVADEASGVTLAYQYRGAERRDLRLLKSGEGYRATLELPATVRRITFHAGATYNGRRVGGSLNHVVERR